MLNSVLMKIRLLTKIVAFLLLPTFLIINASDYAWCFGDDGHVEIRTVACAGPFEESLTQKAATKQQLPRLLEDGDDNCGPCLDLYINQVAVTIKKRHKKISLPTLKIAQTSSLPFSFSQAVSVGKALPQPPRHISQTLLAHRTVVLLH
jgi:hypothetical protein